MTCDDAIELLPWLLNGTLEEGERREIRRHLETCERCREALTDTREAWMTFGQHLPSETLVALAYGEVPQEIDPALAERHLASCPECAAELELARTSHRLEKDERIAVFPGRPVRKERGESRSWRAAALAASLAGVVAASGWIHSARELRSISEQVAEKPPAAAPEPTRPVPAPDGASQSATERQLQELTTRFEAAKESQKKTEERLAQYETEIAELRSQGRGPAGIELNPWTGSVQPGVERSGSMEERVMPADRPSLLTLAPEGPETPREAEIRNESGELVLKGRLPLNPELGQYAISFSSGLKPGRYTIQLYSTEGGKRTPRETYRVRVE